MTIDAALPRVARFSIGRVLRDSLVVFFRNILLFGGVALVVRLLSLFAPVAASFPDPDGSMNRVAFCLTVPGQDLLAGTLTLAAVAVAIVLAVIWWVYAPVIAIEGKGVFASLGRSAQLTKGRRWAIVGVYVVVMIAVVVPLIVIGPTTSLSGALTASPLTLSGAIGFVFYALTTAFYTVLVTVAYFHLRIEKEGGGVEDIVRVFD